MNIDERRDNEKPPGTWEMYALFVFIVFLVWLIH